MARVTVRGLAASICASARRLKAMAAERADIMHTRIHPSFAAVGMPPAASMAAHSANGSANTECSHLIISSVTPMLRNIRTQYSIALINREFTRPHSRPFTCANWPDRPIAQRFARSFPKRTSRVTQVTKLIEFGHSVRIISPQLRQKTMSNSATGLAQHVEATNHGGETPRMEPPKSGLDRFIRFVTYCVHVAMKHVRPALNLRCLRRYFHRFRHAGNVQPKAIHRRTIGIVIEVINAGLEPRHLNLGLVIPRSQAANQPSPLPVRDRRPRHAVFLRRNRHPRVRNHGPRRIDNVSAHLSRECLHSRDADFVSIAPFLRVVGILLAERRRHQIRCNHVATEILYLILLGQKYFPSHQADRNVHARKTQVRSALLRKWSARVHEHK